MPPKKPINQREEREVSDKPINKFGKFSGAHQYTPEGPWHYYNCIRCCDGAAVKVYDPYCAICHDNPMGNWGQDPYITYTGPDCYGLAGGCCAKIIGEGLDSAMTGESYNLSYYGQFQGGCEKAMQGGGQFPNPDPEASGEGWVTYGDDPVDCTCPSTGTTSPPPPGECLYSVEFSLEWPCSTTPPPPPEDCLYTVEFLLEWPCRQTTTTTPCPPTYPKPVIQPCGKDENGEPCECKDVRQQNPEECPDCIPCTTTIGPPIDPPVDPPIEFESSCPDWPDEQPPGEPAGLWPWGGGRWNYYRIVECWPHYDCQYYTKECKWTDQVGCLDNQACNHGLFSIGGTGVNEDIRCGSAYPVTEAEYNAQQTQYTDICNDWTFYSCLWSGWNISDCCDYTTIKCTDQVGGVLPWDARPVACPGGNDVGANEAGHESHPHHPSHNP